MLDCWFHCEVPLTHAQYVASLLTTGLKWEELLTSILTNSSFERIVGTPMLGSPRWRRLSSWKWLPDCSVVARVPYVPDMTTLAPDQLTAEPISNFYFKALCVHSRSRDCCSIRPRNSPNHVIDHYESTDSNIVTQGDHNKKLTIQY